MGLELRDLGFVFVSCISIYSFVILMKEQELRFYMVLVAWWQGGPLVASSWAVSLFVRGHREVTVEWGFCGKKGAVVGDTVLSKTKHVLTHFSVDLVAQGSGFNLENHFLPSSCLAVILQVVAGTPNCMWARGRESRHWVWWFR